MRYIQYAIAGLCFILSAPIAAQAGGVFISELMYDPAGADTGREWFEVCNSDTQAVRFTDYKFFEANTNHAIAEYRGGVSLEAGECGMVVADPVKALIDFGSFNGKIFDSSWSSFLQAGEMLALRYATATDFVDEVTYADTFGASDDGLSLHRSANSWFAAAPTLGVKTTGTIPSVQAPVNSPPPSTSSTDTDTSTQSQSQTSSSSAPPGFVADAFEPTLYADGGSDMSGVVGAPLRFEGKAYGAKRAPLPNARFVWNFGDGAVYVGQATMHTYRSVGQYVASLSVSSGDFSVSDLVLVTVVDSPIVLGEVSLGEAGYVELRNTGSRPVDVSGWLLDAGVGRFIFPTGTFITGANSVRFFNTLTQLRPQQVQDVVLRYPNLSVAATPSAERTNTVANNTPAPVSPAPVSVAKKGEASKEVKKTTAPAAVLEKTASAKTQGQAGDSAAVESSAVAAEAITASKSSLSAVASEANASSSSLVWYGALAVILFAGIIGSLALEKKRPVDEIEIIE